MFVDELTAEIERRVGSTTTRTAPAVARKLLASNTKSHDARNQCGVDDHDLRSTLVVPELSGSGVKINASNFLDSLTKSVGVDTLHVADETSVCTNAVRNNVKILPGSCSILWRAALDAYQTASGRTWFMDRLMAVSSALVGPNPAVGSTSIVAPYLVSLLGAAIVLGVLGFVTQGRVAGVWIDNRNRISLARAQVTLWTVVLLSGYLTFALFNVGYAAVLASTTEWATYHPFPTMDSDYWAALGISTISTILSALTLKTKDKGDWTAGVVNPSPQGRSVSVFGANSSGLDKNNSPADAALADLVLGEENANSNLVDVSRLQNLLITISLVSAVFWQLMESASNIRMQEMLAGADPIIGDLPGLGGGGTFTALFLASHATYLAAKAVDKKGDGPAKLTPGQQVEERTGS